MYLYNYKMTLQSRSVICKICYFAISLENHITNEYDIVAIDTIMGHRIFYSISP